MKSKKIISSVLLVFVFVFAQINSCKAEEKKTFKYKITVQITGQGMMGFGPVILKQSILGAIIQTKYPKGSVVILEGERPIADLNSACFIHLPSVSPNPGLFKPDKWPIVYFALDSTEIIISGHIDSLRTAKVEGDTFTKLSKEFCIKNFPKTIEMKQLMTEINNMSDKMHDSESENKYKSDYERLTSGYTKLMNEHLSDIKLNLDKYKNNIFMIPVITDVAGGFSSSDLYAFFDKLESELKSTAAGRELLSFAGYIKKDEEKTALNFKVGSKAKDAKIYTENDEESSIFALIKELKNDEILVFDFWASWCGPCRREIPFMKDLHKKYESKGVKIIGISIDKELSAWKKALKEENVPYLQLIDKYGYASNVFEVNAVPALFVINKDGVIINMDRGEDLEKFIKAYLQNIN
jgi:thiol-disulfide isomerase/thioredoxin